MIISLVHTLKYSQTSNLTTEIQGWQCHILCEFYICKSVKQGVKVLQKWKGSDKDRGEGRVFNKLYTEQMSENEIVSFIEILAESNLQKQV